MGFHIGGFQSLAEGHALHRGHLVLQAGDDFVATEIHAAPAKAYQVRICGVGAHADTVLGSQRQGSLHGDRVARVEAAGDIGLVDVGHDFGVQTHGPAAVALAEIAIQ